MNKGVRMAVAAGAGALAIGCAVTGANLLGVAHAYPFSGPQGDQSAGAYWVDISSFDHKVTVKTAGEFGDVVCRGLTKGMSEGALIAKLADGDSSHVSDWTFVVHAAEWHFCPSYY
jgi:hypothetical protein